MNSVATSQLEDALVGITEQFKSLTQQMQELGTSLQRLATAGFEATNEGNKLSYVWTLFTRQIAAVALPVMNFLIEKLTQITDWFRALTGEGQDLLLKLGSVAAIFTTVVAVVSVLSAVMSPIAIVIGALVAGLYVFFTETDAGKEVLASITEAVTWMISKWQDLVDVFDLVKFSIGVAVDSVLSVVARLTAGIASVVAEVLDWIPGLGEASKAAAAFAAKASANADEFAAAANKAFTPRDRNAGGEPGKPRRDVNPTGFAFESLSASFERITSAANKTDLAKETLNVQKAQLAALKIIAEGVEGGTGGPAGGGMDIDI